MFPSLTKTFHQTAYAALDHTLPALSAAGKNIVVTGGGSGIGAATALRFAQAGASSVTIIGRRTSQLENTKSKIEQAVSGAKVYTYFADITNGDSVSATFKAIHEAVGDIHVFICNAGYISEPGPIKDADAEEWWTAFQVNIKGTFLTAQAFLHHKAVNAVVIYITSGLSHVYAGPFKSSYVSSKAGAVRFFNALQLEHPELRVISLHPGTVETQMLKKAGHAAGVDDVPGPDVNAMVTFAKESGAMAGDADTFPLNAVAEERISFPPTFIVSAESDILYGEAKLMEEALNEAGTSVKHDAYEGLPHYENHETKCGLSHFALCSSSHMWLRQRGHVFDAFVVDAHLPPVARSLTEPSRTNSSMKHVSWQRLRNFNPLHSLGSLFQVPSDSAEMPPALSDEETSDREMQPSAARSSRSSRSAADDAVIQDEPVAAAAAAAAAAATPDVAGSNGSEDEDMEEDEFIVESIKNHMIDEDGTLKFQVKWEGYDSKKDLTWEPEENLEETAHIILDEYFEAIGGREKIFEQTEKAARGKKRGRGASNAGGNATKRSRRNGTHPADSTPPASAPKQWAPPAGSWEEEIATIDACEEESSGRLVVFLIWKNGMKTKHDTAIIYKKCPQKMLQFYERHVKIIRDDAKSV